MAIAIADRMTNNTLAVIDIEALNSVTGGEGTGQPPSTWIGCTASAVGNWMQGQSGGGALSDWGRCVQTGNPIPQGGTQPGQS